MFKMCRVFFLEIAVKIPFQKTHLGNLTCKIAVIIPSQKTHLGNITCNFPEKYIKLWKKFKKYCTLGGLKDKCQFFVIGKWKQKKDEKRWNCSLNSSLNILFGKCLKNGNYKSIVCSHGEAFKIRLWVISYSTLFLVNIIKVGPYHPSHSSNLEW